MEMQEKSTFNAPPASNTGGLARSEAYQHCVIVGGKLKEILIKKGKSTAAFIDTLTVVFPEDTFVRPDQLGTDEEIAANASAVAAEIFGYGFLKQNTGGRNGYKISYHMGTETENYGFFAMGGKRQNNTVCLFMTGVGLTAALDGWESRLYDYIQAYAPSAKITRCDLAHDFLNGEYTPDMALRDWENGGYTSRHTKPIAECVGGDWLHYLGTGKTLYIGSRKNASRFVRVYEKGKQLGDSESPWVRVELELHSRDIVIPHEILIDAGQYLTGAFPAFESLFFSYEETPAKVERVKKQQDVSAEHCIKYGSMQVSGVINLLKRMGLDDAAIVETLKNGKKNMPKRLNPAAFDCATESLTYIHECHRVPRDVYSVFESTFGVDGAKMKHRTYDEYLADVENRRLNEQFRVSNTKFDSEDAYNAYMWRRHATPDFISNRKINS
ncbi:replication initiation factor domain-containing protein [Neisseria iguanae]|uniref:Replication initiation factor n=1 Tax=Neisseria iguanae TaxID=90242 RepID=A0A2P7TYM2_9NEIS|nr:replication initiation factor domain-containing protein [Neisseria iguanae]PSJ79807.1 replication initiation factor [Neisseria iguanae]